MRPETGLAQIACYGQLFGSLLIIVLLVFLILTSLRERYREDLDAVVRELGAASQRTCDLIESNYDLTIAAAEALLVESNREVAKGLLMLRYGLPRAIEMLESLPPSNPNAESSPATDGVAPTTTVVTSVQQPRQNVELVPGPAAGAGLAGSQADPG